MTAVQSDDIVRSIKTTKIIRTGESSSSYKLSPVYVVHPYVNNDDYTYISDSTDCRLTLILTLMGSKKANEIQSYT